MENNTKSLNDIREWIESGKTEPLTTMARYNELWTLIHYPRDESFEYIYGQHRYTFNTIDGIADLSSTIDRQNMRYLGMYYRGDRHFYDCFWLSELLTDYSAPRDDYSDRQYLLDRTDDCICDALTHRVRQIVENEVQNDKCNLKISRFTEASYDERLERKKSYALNTVEDAFLRADTDELSFAFQCKYRMDTECILENDLLKCIINSELFAKEEAQKYIDEHQNDILLQLLLNEEYGKVWQEFKGTKSFDEDYKRKKIAEAVNGTTGKTLKVAIEKDGIASALSISRGELTNRRTGCYWIYDSPKKDRGMFEELYGHNAEIMPSDIKTITYGRRTLYAV